MKVAILAGGLGSRMDPQGAGRADDAEGSLPKALAPLGGRPILWHILARYACFGLVDFTIALGHKGDRIRAWFRGEGRADGPAGEEVERLSLAGPDGATWSVTLVETGAGTNNGGRIGRLRPFLGKKSFMLTWCDGVTDLDLEALRSFHEGHGRLATVTAVHPPSDFGALSLEGDRVVAFEEKPEAARRWINGAYFVLEPGIFDLIEGDDCSWERGPMVELARRGELMAFRHEGFWQCMDTAVQRHYLDDLWARGKAPWNCWS